MWVFPKEIDKEMEEIRKIRMLKSFGLEEEG